VKLSVVLAVARFELLRFFKLKDQLVGLVTMLAVGLGAYGVSVVVKRSGAGPVSVAVLGPGAEQLAAESRGRFEWRVASDGRLAELREQVAGRQIDGVLVLGRDGSAELLSRRAPAWQREIQALLDDRARRQRMVDAGVAPDTLARIFSPVSLKVVTLASAGAARQGAGLAAGTAVGLMLLGILLGNAYLLVGITGEKQLRVTEQVVAAISPQTWIDGKILGLSALTLAMLALYVVPSLVGVSILRWFGVNIPALPAAAGDPLFLAALVAFASLGFLLWFTFFAAIAATVDDPNNSSRGGWLLFPLLPLGLAFAVMRDPDAPLARVLGLLPPTAPTVMPVRMLLGEVPLFELLLALAGLVLAIWMLRRAAGRIFELGMLMYGKEPSWREIWRLARA
jgi:ABC-2 type transport system permease protein